MTSKQSGFFEGQGGVKIAFDVAGRDNAQPVCLIHGGGQTRHSWSSAVRALAESGYRAFTLDLRGHGDSDWAPPECYKVEDYCGDLRVFASMLGEPPIIVGASLGGICATLAAGEEPRLDIKGLILVDVAARMRRQGGQAILRFMLSTLDGFESLDDAADAVARYLPHRPRPKANSGLMKNLRMHPHHGKLKWHWDPAPFLAPFDSESVSARLERSAERIDAPTFLLRGDASELVTDEIAKKFIAHFRNGRVHTILRAHHMVAGESNDVFNRVMLEVCKTITTSSA